MPSGVSSAPWGHPAKLVLHGGHAGLAADGSRVPGTGCVQTAARWEWGGEVGGKGEGPEK